VDPFPPAVVVSELAELLYTIPRGGGSAPLAAGSVPT